MEKRSKPTTGRKAPVNAKKFSKDYQPPAENKAKGKLSQKLLTSVLLDELEGQKEMIIEGIDVNTGEKTRVKVKAPTKEIIVRALLMNAAKGKERSIEMVFDRIEGKPLQVVETDFTPPVGPDYSKLSDRELMDMAKIHKKMYGNQSV